MVKLLAVAKENEQKQVEVRSALHFCQKPPAGSVNDVFNAVFVYGDAVGEIMHYGRGAGPASTASAVVGI